MQFINFDSTAFHSASVLHPDQSGNPFPKFFNGNGNPASVTLTPLSDPNFTTGLVPNNTGTPARSPVYSTGTVDNTYYIGDYVTYDFSPSMRTVIIVTGC